MSNMANAGLFLIQTVFDLYLLILVLRLFLQIVGASYYNPISQFAVKVTDPLVQPLRRILPSYRSFDIAIIVVFLLVDIIKFSLVISIAGYEVSNAVAQIFALVIRDIFIQTINLFFYATLLRVIVSWLNPGRAHPILDILFQLTEPLLRPVRRFIPLVSGMDLSPLVVLLALQVLLILLG